MSDNKKKRGRPKKYSTEEERTKAIRKQQKEYKLRNKERFKEENRLKNILFKAMKDNGLQLATWFWFFLSGVKKMI